MAAHGSAYDILPIASGERLRLGQDGVLEGLHSAGAAGFLDALENWWSESRVTAEPGSLPFTGGWLVYLSYEVAAEIEPTLVLPPNTDPLVALAVRAPAAWIRDRRTMQAWLIAEPDAGLLLERFAMHVAELDESPREAPREAPAPPLKLAEDDPAVFIAAVRRALEYIVAGDVYQANLSREWRGLAAAPIDPLGVYRRLRRTNPSPFAGILRDGNFTLLSSSPERLVSIRGDRVATRPIAGTRPRGATPEADAALIETLLANEKERAEHVMLIDLERNDLGRVCVGGSVHVDEYMSVETYAHVHHIVSNVSGTLAPGTSPIAVLRAMFPGGTITGCPKVRCMQIIGELEGVGRGAYTGSLGYLNRDGSADFNILIRTITVTGNTLRLRAGAGIVADSDPQAELAETRAKALGVLRAIVEFS